MSTSRFVTCPGPLAGRGPRMTAVGRAMGAGGARKGHGTTGISRNERLTGRGASISSVRFRTQLVRFLTQFAMTPKVRFRTQFGLTRPPMMSRKIKQLRVV